MICKDSLEVIFRCNNLGRFNKSQLSTPSIATSVSTKTKSAVDKHFSKETAEERRERANNYVRATLAKIGLVFQDQNSQPKQKKIIRIHKDKLVNVSI